jgi:hypothetical protein
MVAATPGDTCGAASLQSYIGQPESRLAAMNFANPVRIIHPTDRVTMDMLPGRINFIVDAKGIITAIRCG